MKTINSNHLDYINNELMNMDENTYSHYKLYEWYTKYLDYRCFTEDDWNNLRKIHKKKIEGWSILPDNMVTEEALPTPAYFKWKDRYNTLRQNTIFAQYLFKISHIFWSTESNEEFLIKCNLIGIKDEDVNFYIVWNYNTPGFEFPFDWKTIKYDPKCGNGLSYKKFTQLTELFEDITNNNKAMSTYEEFVSSENGN